MNNEAKVTEPLDLSDPDQAARFVPQIIAKFAAFMDTRAVVNALMKHQDEHISPMVHKSRREIREMIRTFNPNNAKFNHAKWGQLLEESRREFIADLRSKTGNSISTMLAKINSAVKTASISIETPKDLLDAARAMELLQRITRGSDDSPLDLKALPLPPTGSLGASPQKALPAKSETGTNGQVDTA